MTARADHTFVRWHLVPFQGYIGGKDKANALVRVSLDIKQRVFSNDKVLVTRTLRKDCKAWILLRMGVVKSTVGQTFVPIYSTDQTSIATQQVEQIMSDITTRGAGILTEGERRRPLESLKRLRAVYLKVLLSERSLSLTVNKTSLIDQLIKS